MTQHSDAPLHLYEECLLLAIGDKTGAFVGIGQPSFLAAASILAELLLDGVLAIEGSQKSVVFNQHRSYNDPNLDDVLAKLSEASGSYTLQHWLGRLSGLPNFTDNCVQQLCDRDILKSRKETVLWFFNRKTYPELDPEPENRIRRRLREAIESDGEVAPRLTTLVGLAAQFDLLKSFMSISELKQYANRIEQLSQGNASVNATKDAIAAQQAAAECASTAAIIVVTLMD